MQFSVSFVVVVFLFVFRVTIEHVLLEEIDLKCARSASVATKLKFMMNTEVTTLQSKAPNEVCQGQKRLYLTFK
jgi:hypothetical protein